MQDTNLRKTFAGLKETVRLLVRYVTKVGRRVRDLERRADRTQYQMETVTTILEKQNEEIEGLKSAVRKLTKESVEDLRHIAELRSAVAQLEKGRDPLSGDIELTPLKGLSSMPRTATVNDETKAGEVFAVSDEEMEDIRKYNMSIADIKEIREIKADIYRKIARASGDSYTPEPKETTWASGCSYIRTKETTWGNLA
jgi:predicted RNase H-like nuclease (RuvC/YqgF family)